MCVKNKVRNERKYKQCNGKIMEYIEREGKVNRTRNILKEKQR